MSFWNLTLYEDDREEALEKLPKCDCCKQPIQDSSYITTPDGEKYCNECEYENGKDLWFKYGRNDFLTPNEGEI